MPVLFCLVPPPTSDHINTFYLWWCIPWHYSCHLQTDGDFATLWWLLCHFHSFCSFHLKPRCFTVPPRSSEWNFLPSLFLPTQSVAGESSTSCPSLSLLLTTTCPWLLFILETGSYYVVRLTWTSLHRPGSSRTHRVPSASQVLWLKVCSFLPNSCVLFHDHPPPQNIWHLVFSW